MLKQGLFLVPRSTLLSCLGPTLHVLLKLSLSSFTKASNERQKHLPKKLSGVSNTTVFSQRKAHWFGNKCHRTQGYTRSSLLKTKQLPPQLYNCRPRSVRCKQQRLHCTTPIRLLFKIREGGRAGRHPPGGGGCPRWDWGGDSRDSKIRKQIHFPCPRRDPKVPGGGG